MSLREELINGLCGSEDGKLKKYQKDFNTKRKPDTYASNNSENLIGVRVGKAASRVHFVNKEWYGASAKFFDEDVGKKIIILGKVARLHLCCWPPRNRRCDGIDPNRRRPRHGRARMAKTGVRRMWDKCDTGRLKAHCQMMATC